MAFLEAGIELTFKGEQEDEAAYVKACHLAEYQLPIGKEVLCVDPRYFRPTEVDLLLGDATKAREKLNWLPKYDVQSLIKEMVASDLLLAQRDQFIKQGGYTIMNKFK